jgi:hypothetical protein
VRTYRTPGGHRRFLEEDIRALTVESGTPELDLLMSATVGRARLEASGGRLATQDWYARLDEGAKERHRALGRELMTLLVEYLRHPAGSGQTLDSARRIGRLYGQMARREGLSVGDAMRAFLAFHEMLEASVDQLASLQPRPDLHRQVFAFVGEVLIAMVEAFTQASE